MKYIYGKKLNSFRKKLTSIVASAAILANSMGVALPILLTQKVAAAPAGEITHVGPALVNAHNYSGITVTIKTQNITTAENITVTVNRAFGGSVVKTAKSSVVTAINTAVGEKTTTAPIVINNISYNEAGSGSWNPPVNPIWNSSTVPESVTVSITGSDGLNLTRTENVTGTGLYQSMLPAPSVNAENFNTHNGTDYRGVNVGFNASNFSNVSNAKVELYRGAILEATNTATPALLGAINNTAVANANCNPGAGNSFSTPFVTVERSYVKADDPCWTMTNYVVTNKNFKPTRAVITLTQDGVDYVATTSGVLSEATVEFQYVITMRIPPSTNELNKVNNMPYVELVESTNDTVELKFVNPTTSYAYFEYKIDGETPATYPNGAPLKTPHSWLGAGEYEYPGAGLDNRYTLPTTETTKTFSADEKVEVRFALGNPGTAFFDWTPFFTTPHPDPTNSNQLTLSGIVFNNRNSDRDRDADEEVLSNWTVRAYKENSGGDWELVGTTITRPSDNQYSIRQYEAGVYHVCIVNQTGWTQIRQDWAGTPYHITTDNLSGATDEGNWCSTVNYDDTADHSNAKYFGMLDTQLPTGNAIYHGGVINDGTHYLKTIEDLSFTETIQDNYGVVRATYLVQKYNNSTEKFEGFCGNWNARSSGSHVLGGATNEVKTITNIKDCAADTSTWTDGTYKIFHAAYDSNGNEGKFNADRHVFVIDSTPPLAVITSPINGSIFNGGVLSVSGTVSDSSGMSHYSIYLYNGTVDLSDGEVHSGSRVKTPGGWTAGGQSNVAGLLHQNVSRTLDLSLLDDGEYQIRLAVRDLAGNLNPTDSVDVVRFTVDKTAPDAPANVNIWQNGTNKTNGYISDRNIVVTWTAPSNDVDYYEYQAAGSAGWTQANPWTTTVNGTSRSGEVQGSDGDRYYRVRAVDHAGNKGAWSDWAKVTLDTIAPESPADLQLTTQPSGSVYVVGDTNFTNEEDATFSWNAVAGAIGYNFYPWNDNGTYLPNTKPTSPVNGSDPHTSTSITALFIDGEDTYHVCVTAVDAAGNESVCSEILTVTYDLTPPALTLASIPSNSSTSRVISGTSDPNANIEVTVHSTPQTRTTTANANGNWSLTFNNLEPGMHSVRVTSTDAAGNTRTENGSFEVTSSQTENGGVVESANTNEPSGRSGNQGGRRSATTDTGSVLAAETGDVSNDEMNRGDAQSELDEARTLASNDENSEEESDNNSSCSKILGLCWYLWIPIVIAVLGTIYYVTSRRADEK